MTSPVVPVQYRPNALQRAWYFVTMRPYGRELLTRANNGYLITLALVMLLAAGAEAVAWGYLGTTFTPHQPLWGGAALGCFVFALFWLFDRSLVTHDLMLREHGQCFGRHAAPPDPAAQLVSKPHPLVQYKGYIGRFAMVMLSMWMTAPYMTQLAFRADIENQINRLHVQAVRVEKERVIKQMQEEQQKQIQRIEQSTAKLSDEMNGTGGSRRFGYGVNAAAIQAQINLQEQRLDQLKTEELKRVADIEKAFADQDFKTLASLGVVIDQDSPILRTQAIEDIQKNPAFLQTEHTIMVLLLILAGAMLGMKLMQPYALKLYFTGRLQEQWSLYRLGRYDADLPETDRSHYLLSSADALPVEFEALLKELFAQKEWQARKQQELREQREAAAQLAARQAAEAEEAQRLAAQKAHEEAEAQRLAAQQAAEALQQAEQAYLRRLAEEKSATELRHRSEDFQEQQIREAVGQIDQAERVYLDRHQDEINQLQREKTALEDTLHTQQAIHKTHVERIEARRQRIEETRQDIQALTTQLEQLRQREDSDRLQVLRVIQDQELALIRHAERLSHQQAELLGFELAQRTHVENQQHDQQALNRVQARLQALQQPLDAIVETRSAVEARRIRLMGQQGLMDSPFVPHGEEELPLLIERMRQQLSVQVPLPVVPQPVRLQKEPL